MNRDVAPLLLFLGAGYAASIDMMCAHREFARSANHYAFHVVDGSHRLYTLGRMLLVADVVTVAKVATVLALPARGGPSHAAHEHTDVGGDDGGDGSKRDDRGGHVAGTTWAVPCHPRSPP